MIISTALPVVTGGVGAPVATANLASKKTIIAKGVVGVIKIEASGDGIEYSQVATVQAPVNDLVIEIAAAFMRVNASATTKTTSTNVQVLAEQTLVRSATIPTPPTNGPGAAVNISALNRLATVYLGAFSGKGNVKIEASGDGINWSQVLSSFTASDWQTGDLPAKWVRAVGNNATGVISVSADDSDGSGVVINSPMGAFVYRPGDPLGPRGNVYTVWTELYAALQAVKGLGFVNLEFDATYGPAAPAPIFAARSITIPARAEQGTGDAIGGAAPNMTLTDAGAAFTQAMVGQYIRINAPTTPNNEGTFLITAVGGPTTLTYTNPFGVAEAFAGTWGLAWDMREVRWTNNATDLTALLFADNCFLAQLTDISGGNGLFLVNNSLVSTPIMGATGIFPYLFPNTVKATQINIGARVELCNTVAGARPLIKVPAALPQGGAFIAGVPNIYGGVGIRGTACASPVVDLNGSVCIFTAVPVENNAITDTSATGLGIVYVQNINTLTFTGSAGGQTWELIGLPTTVTSLIVTAIRPLYRFVSAVPVAPVLATGTGDAIGGTAPNQTLTDAAGLFTAAMIGKYVTIAGSGIAANNGTFLISAVTGTTIITYGNNNVGAAAEAVFPGTWSIPGYAAIYNELVPVNTAAVRIIQLPTAIRPRGESVIVKDATGTGAAFPILIRPKAGQTVDLVPTTEGTGDAIGGAAPAMTLTDAAGAFTAAMVGRFITIVGSTTPANDGTFLITAFGGATVITYTNAAGVAEAFAGTYSIDSGVGTDFGSKILVPNGVGNWLIISQS